MSVNGRPTGTGPTSHRRFCALRGAADVAFRVVGSKGDIRLDPAYEYAGGLKEYLTVEGKTKEKTFPKSDQFAPELVTDVRV
jgi:glucose-fructose oxidoreductase